ncbi:MAG: PIN domain-containing protein [Candidatus Marsarchaeota archaeon]|nr:PIN domain-containing protein [Candidatus Marsarchaeota archaeon]MCL5105957.1 PIN domain-containing protein [Candidatus Marsarchaeota archaeon]
MKDNLFFDTSVLVYAFDYTEYEKQKPSKRYVEAVFEGKNKGVISNQVLAELFNVLTRHVTSPLSKEIARNIVDDFILSEHWEKINYTHITLRKAMQTSRQSNVQLWDSLIAETMKENEVTKILTENIKDFGRIAGITTVNPFAKA